MKPTEMKQLVIITNKNENDELTCQVDLCTNGLFIHTSVTVGTDVDISLIRNEEIFLSLVRMISARILITLVEDVKTLPNMITNKDTW